MKTLLVTNRKGGVGKTTTTLAISSLLAYKGLKVLVVDLDTQGHIQYGLGIKHEFPHGIHSVLQRDNLDIEFVIQKSKIKNLHFIPADINFNSSKLSNNAILRENLSKIKDKYDICIIDTAPMSDNVLEMAVKASDFVIVPMKTEYLGLVGTVQFIKIFYKLASNLETDFKFLGVIPTLYNKSLKEHKEILEKLQDITGKAKVFTPIRKDIKMMSIFRYGIKHLQNKHSVGYKDYSKALEILLKKMGISNYA